MRGSILFIIIMLMLQVQITTIYSQNYPLSTVSEDLKNNSKIIIRSFIREIDVISEKQVKEHAKLVLTIINENGLEDADLVRFYNKFISIKKLKATLYDEYGKKIKTLDRDNFRDFSAVSSISLFEDSRVKYIDCDYATTPFTVEYSWETNYSGIIDYNDWMPVWDYNISLEHAKLVLASESSFGIRHKASGPFEYTEYNEKDKTIRTWTLDRFPAIEEEVFSPPRQLVLPVIYISPLTFELDNYPGSSDTWENFGLWIKKLNDDQSELNEESKNEILSLLEGISDTHEKINTLYEYLQNKTRYVNISIGIGGWKPLSPQVVHEKSYGDCKALTHYMHTILDIGGIQSHYTIINAGQNALPLMADFPSNQFNHAILCVPIKGDTIWLECTNQYTPAGYVSTFIDDRKALLIDSAGAHLVKTSYGQENYHQKKNITRVEITPELDGKIHVEQSYSGYFYDENQMLLRGDANDIKKYLLQNIRFSNFELIDYSIDEKRGNPPLIIKKMQIHKVRIIENIGSRYILNLNILNEGDRNNFTNQSRSSDILVKRNLTEIDSTAFTIPENLKVHFVPDPVSLESEFGAFTSKVIIDANQIIRYRKFQLKKGFYPSGNYQRFAEFLESVYEKYNQKCILQEI